MYLVEASVKKPVVRKPFAAKIATSTVAPHRYSYKLVPASAGRFHLRVIKRTKIKAGLLDIGERANAGRCVCGSISARPEQSHQFRFVYPGDNRPRKSCQVVCVCFVACYAVAVLADDNSIMAVGPTAAVGTRIRRVRGQTLSSNLQIWIDER